MRLIALLAAAALAVAAVQVDPCKRQPFRGRCPSKNGAPQTRSQFVLRYYMRNGECVSYPFGHCATDEKEAKLFRYKEECEDACVAPGNLGVPKEHDDATYESRGPVRISVGNEQSYTDAPAAPSPKVEGVKVEEVERPIAVPSTSTEATEATTTTEEVTSPVTSAATTEQATQPTTQSTQSTQSTQAATQPTTQRTVPTTESTTTTTTERIVPSTAAVKVEFTTQQSQPSSTVHTTQSTTQRASQATTQRTVPTTSGRAAQPAAEQKTEGTDSDIPSSPICALPKERGPCDKYELRFYYNAELKECKYFFYGGCDGNENNFEKVEECEAACPVKRSHVQAPRASTTARPAQTQTQFAQTAHTQPAQSRQPVATSTARATTTSSQQRQATQQQHQTTQQHQSVVHHEGGEAQPLPTEFAAPVEEKGMLEATRCVHPQDAGDCGGSFVRWSWSHSSHDCESFHYTGCKGNGNNFASREECMRICNIPVTKAPPPPDFVNVCHHDVDAGDCNGVFTRFAFDGESGECRPFTYGGCGGNGNNFPTIAECKKKCAPQTLVAPNAPGNVCEHPIDGGECSGRFSRYGFDQENGDCAAFNYGGCGGNGNNFASLLECRSACAPHKCDPHPPCEFRCEVKKDANGCSICACPAGTINAAAAAPAPKAVCAPIDTAACADPCIVIANRKGCQECVCPVVPERPVSNNIAAPPAPRAPAPPAPRVAAPAPAFHVPAPAFHAPAPPAPRQETREFRTERIEENLIEPAPPAPRVAAPPAPPAPTSAPATRTGFPPAISEMTDKCLEPADPGPCKHYVDRWHFNQVDGACRPFKYGGCAGNRNHFFTQKECEIHCARFSRVIAAEATVRAAGVTQQFTTESYSSPTPALRELPEAVAFAEKTVEQAPVPAVAIKTDEVKDDQIKQAKAMETIDAEEKGESEESEEELEPLPMPQPIPVGNEGGREPVPQTATGIGRSMENVQIEDAEQPTTIIPPTTHAAAPAAPVPAPAAAPAAPAPTAAPIKPDTELFGPPQQTIVKQDINICSFPADAGPCFDYKPRWFFNGQTRLCEQFSYGNCGGNQNNFADRTRCEAKCMRNVNRGAMPAASLSSQVPARCAFEKDSGFGNGYHVKWYFNMRNLRCEQFVYEGEGGNDNQFDTLTDCERYCTPQPVISRGAPAQPLPAAPPASPPAAMQAAAPDTEPTVATAAATSATRAPQPPPQPIAVTFESINNDISEEGESEEEEDEELPLGPALPSPVMSPATEPRAPAVQASKTLLTEQTDKQIKELPEIKPIPASTSAPAAPAPAAETKVVYKAEPLPVAPAVTGNEELPIVGPSPPMTINYQTGHVKAQAAGIRTFQESNGRVEIENAEDIASEEKERARMPSCPNRVQEMRYADGRPVMCLPGKNQCPEKSVCYFNGIDYFCCPNTDDPYDKHAFGGYDGEESKVGYKVFGPLRIRQLRDEPISRTKRSSMVHQPRVEFSLDPAVQPSRFDGTKPRQFSRAQSMSRPVAPVGGAICLLPLVKGDCNEAHLRFFYDRDSDSCRLFYYSGCQGNANNFGSMDDCRAMCQINKKSAPAAAVPAGQCPVGKPLGGSAPVLCGNGTESIGCPGGYYCRQGPPDVCCPGVDPKLSLGDLVSRDIRFSPKMKTDPRMEQAENKEESTASPVPSSTKPNFLATPKHICPDASDPLMENGEPMMCGAGFDGVAMCPRGYYCSMNAETQSRLCCAMFGIGGRLPSDPVIAPYFGRRPANPGEVIERGSLPSDQTDAVKSKEEGKPSLSVAGSDAVADSAAVAKGEAPVPAIPAGAVEEKKEQEEKKKEEKMSNDSEEEEEEDDDEEEEKEMAHLMMKPLSRHQKEQQKAAEAAVAHSSVESSTDDEGVDMPLPFHEEEETTPAPKQAIDRSICMFKPSEGRVCREDEPAPRTNLHYFYSAKDKRCKLYFYKGCGGNANRFEKKQACEAMCMP